MQRPVAPGVTPREFKTIVGDFNWLHSGLQICGLHQGNIDSDPQQDRNKQNLAVSMREQHKHIVCERAGFPDFQRSRNRHGFGIVSSRSAEASEAALMPPARQTGPDYFREISLPRTRHGQTAERPFCILHESSGSVINLGDDPSRCSLRIDPRVGG